MKIGLNLLLVLVAVIISAAAGCVTTGNTITDSTIAISTTVLAPDTTATSSAVPATTAAPATVTGVATAPASTFLVPATTDVFSKPPLVPPDPAVYPIIVGGVTTVILADGHFAPPIIMVPVGTTVEWQVTDHLSDHAIYGDDGQFWGGVIAWIPLDKTFTVPGTFSYHDVESMGGNGTVIVF